MSILASAAVLCGAPISGAPVSGAINSSSLVGAPCSNSLEVRMHVLQNLVPLSGVFKGLFSEMGLGRLLSEPSSTCAAPFINSKATRWQACREGSFNGEFVGHPGLEGEVVPVIARRVPNPDASGSELSGCAEATLAEDISSFFKRSQCSNGRDIFSVFVEGLLGSRRAILEGNCTNGVLSVPVANQDDDVENGGYRALELTFSDWNGGSISRCVVFDQTAPVTESKPLNTVLLFVIILAALLPLCWYGIRCNQDYRSRRKEDMSMKVLERNQEFANTDGKGNKYANSLHLRPVPQGVDNVDIDQRELIRVFPSVNERAKRFTVGICKEKSVLGSNGQVVTNEDGGAVNLYSRICSGHLQDSDQAETLKADILRSLKLIPKSNTERQDLGSASLSTFFTLGRDAKNLPASVPLCVASVVIAIVTCPRDTCVALMKALFCCNKRTDDPAPGSQPSLEV